MELSQQYKTKALKKLDDMERYISELEDITPSSEEYNDSLVKKRACEKTIELAIECIIDVCTILATAFRTSVPSDEDDLLSVLGKKKIFSSELVKIISGMKGFRNILIHKYGVVDDDRVYEFITENLDDFELFGKEVRSVLKNGTKK